MTGLARVNHNWITGRTEIATDDRGFIALDAGLETAVLLSLFTDRRARPSDRESHRRGWWGDAHARVRGDEIGSRLWLLRRQRASTTTVRRAQLYAAEALAWLETDGLAKRVTVVAEHRPAQGGILLNVQIERPDGTTWAAIWDIHGRRVSNGLE